MRGVREGGRERSAEGKGGREVRRVREGGRGVRVREEEK